MRAACGPPGCPIMGPPPMPGIPYGDMKGMLGCTKGGGGAMPIAAGGVIIGNGAPAPGPPMKGCT